MMQLQITRSVAIGLIVVFVLLGLLAVVEIFFYTLPTQAEVNQRLLTVASTTPNWLSFQVVSIIAANRSQVALTKYQRADAPLICLNITVWVKRVLSGASEISSAGPCYNPSMENPPIQLISLPGDGYIAGGQIVDPAIKMLRANWVDGTSSTLNITEGTFLAIQPDSLRLLSIEGLDSSGTPITNSLTYDEETFRLTHGASTVLPVDGGNIVVISYSIPSPKQQECVQVKYQTRETLTKAVLGQMYIPSAIACSQGDTIGPSVEVELGGGILLVGRIVDPAATGVRIRWKDGREQTSLLTNGIYAFQHPRLPSSGVEIFAIHDVLP